jgi:hypothetical protein
MKGSILPTADFRQANIHDVVEFLAASGNVNLMLSLDEDSESIATPNPFGTKEAGANIPLVTFKAEDISVYDTLCIVCELANLSWSVENSIVIIRRPTVAQKEPFPDKWKYDGSFHDLADIADRIVIRNGGFNCCGPVDNDTILLSITNIQEIAEFNSLFQFETNQTWDACMCCGFPGIDWYRGRYRLALTGLQHGRALRWKGFPGDAFFTKESSKRLAQWMLNHHIPDPHNEFKKLVTNQQLPTKPSLSSESTP